MKITVHMDRISWAMTKYVAHGDQGEKSEGTRELGAIKLKWEETIVIGLRWSQGQNIKKDGSTGLKDTHIGIEIILTSKNV